MSTTLIVHSLLFVIGFILLIKGGDWLVDSASALASHFHVSELVIGLTIVSFGTSAPELLVNIYASLSGVENIALGNILGSNVANILLVLGLSAMVIPLRLQERTIRKEIPFALVVTVVLGILSNDFVFEQNTPNIITNGDGLLLLIFFGFFLYYIYSSSLEKSLISELPDLSRGKAILFMLLGIVGLGIGGKIVVESAEIIALNLGVSDAFIGLTLVAFGTSLPELATSLNAAKKAKTDLAIGNVVGSNIFNILLVLGVSTTIKDIPYAIAFNFDLAVAAGAVILLFLAMFFGKKNGMARWEGIVFISLYILYIISAYYLQA